MTTKTLKPHAPKSKPADTTPNPTTAAPASLPEGFGARLYAAFQAGAAGQAEIFKAIAEHPQAIEMAKITLAECDECKEKEMALAKEAAGEDELLLRRSVAAVYQWHTRSATVLKAILAGHWLAIEGLAYTQMYAVAAGLIRPQRRRSAPAGRPVQPRQLKAVERVLTRLDGEQALLVLNGLAQRFKHLGVAWAAGLADSLIQAMERVDEAPELAAPPPNLRREEPPERRMRRPLLMERLAVGRERLAA